MLAPGQSVGNRFEIEREAGSGGMGVVFRARDRERGGVVALKVMRGLDAPRFEREAAVIADLRHPAIVGYVAHGSTADGAKWLAMEWIDGEALTAAIERGPLGVDAVIALARTLADALAVVHRAGVVHRDLKPSNVLLRGGDPARPVLIDFGVARGAPTGTVLTRTGDVVGSPRYMAPEQARGARTVDARADVYAVGTLLYEMLAGRPPFDGENALAVLAKILLEPAPPVRALRPDVPDALAVLVDRLLAKDPERRPAEGGALSAALDAASRGVAPASGPAEVRLGAAERRVTSLVVVGPSRDSRCGDEDAATLPAVVPEMLRAIATAHQARLDALADGSMVATIEAGGTAADAAVIAARCALALRPRLPGRPLAVVTSRLALGEGIDRAARLLGDDAGIRLDEATAALLGDRFEVRDGLLTGERGGDPGSRTLLGKRTPCVGRDWELGVLEALCEESAAERSPRTALVIGAPGAGKTRLRTELVARLRGREAPPRLLRGRAQVIGSGSAFGALADLLRETAGIAEGAPIETRRERLAARVAESVAPEEATRVAEMLGEIAGVPFDDAGRERLAAARRDARIMADALRAAWEDFVSAECARGPTVLLLDDLQWAGGPTIAFVDAALRNLGDRPLAVIAFARPEVEQTFPELWRERDVQVVRLRPLAARACRTLAEEALGGRADDATIARIVQRADGNAFFLEELIRTVAEGGGDALPETVLGTVQARLDALDGEDRRLLRAASVFGEAFWTAGVAELLGGADGLEARLDHLIRRELVTRRTRAAIAGETELAFRHALVRECAYASLTENDRRVGHALAGEWLEESGSTDALALAQHYDRGGRPERAVAGYARAAAQALEGYDYATSLVRAERGLACGATGADRGALERIRAEAHHLRGEYREAAACAAAASELLPPGSREAFHALRLAVAASASLGDLGALREAARRAQTAQGQPDALAARAVCLAEAAGQLLILGSHEDSGVMLDQARSASAEDPLARAWLGWVSSHRALQSGDPAAYLRGVEDALAGFERAGDARYACAMQIGIGYASVELGLLERAEEVLRQALAGAERLGLRRSVAAALSNLGQAVAHAGRFAEACEIERRAAELSREIHNDRYQGVSRAYLALALIGAGDALAAEREAREAVRLLRAVPPLLALGLAAHASALLAIGSPDPAHAAAAEAMTLVRAGGLDAGEALARLVHAETLHATGAHAEAHTAIAEAAARLHERAAKIPPDLRSSFLERVPENARTLHLATTWEGNGSLPLGQ